MKGAGELQPRELRQRLPRSAEEFEQQNIALAMKLSSERLRDGTASAAEIVYWLKQGSPQAQFEKHNLELQGQLLEAKTKALNSGQKDNADYEAALNAFKGYRSSVTLDGEFEELQ